MGSAKVLNLNADSTTLDGTIDPGMKRGRGRGKHSVERNAVSNDVKMDSIVDAAIDVKKRKRNGSEINGDPIVSRKMPKRAASCSDFKEKSLRLSEKSSMVETKQDRLVEEEIIAIKLTQGEHEDPRPTRKLMDFVFHDTNGIPQPFEMSEVDDLFVSAHIMPLDEKEKEKAVRCEGFGRIESWAISGYEEGSPVIWVSTDAADYDCIKPASSYKKFFDHFFEKARTCIEVFKKLSKSYGGNPDISFDELLAGVVRSMSGSKNFPGGAPGKDFVVSLGDFIYNQLIGLDETSKKNDQMFTELPVLVTLRNECKKRGDFNKLHLEVSNGSIKIKDGVKLNGYGSSTGVDDDDDDDDEKLARLLQEEEYWKSMKQKRNRNPPPSSNKFYIKINEDEIANDYPLPAYYKTSIQEMDEYVIFDSDINMCYADDLPRSMLHNWSLYNSDSRLISLELLPMKPCAEVDLTIFGSGTMTGDDGSGFCIDADSGESSSSALGSSDVDGIPIYLSAIKEWMIEFGSSMVFISIRTDMAWYRLGKPSKQYSPWYKPVLKTARLAISIITLLKEQSRVSRLSFADIIKRVSEFDKHNPAYISSNPSVAERYIVVHGQIILQQFAEFPDEMIKKSAFVTGLSVKMEERHHTKLLMKKKVMVQKEKNLNPRAAMGPVVSKRKAMRATTTRMVNRIWGGYYSNFLLEDSNEGDERESKEDEEVEEQEDNEEEVEEENVLVQEKTTKTHSPMKPHMSKSNSKIEWVGESVGKMGSGEALYQQVTVRGDEISVGGALVMETDELEDMPVIIFVEYMFEKLDGRRMVHGMVMRRGSQTILGNAANEREVFMTNQCKEFELGDVKEAVVVKIRSIPWGHQHRKENANADMIDREKAEERQKKGLPMEYYCKSLYWPERGAFYTLSFETMGLGIGVCNSCKLRETQEEEFKVNSSMTSFIYKGTEYSVHDFVYVSPYEFATEIEEGHGSFKAGRNVGLKPYVVCHLLEIEAPKGSKQACPKSMQVKVRRFYRPDDISTPKAYSSDIREVFYCEEILRVPLEAIEGKCVVQKNPLPPLVGPVVFDHIFFCEYIYDPAKGTIKQLPANVKLSPSQKNVVHNTATRKNKGKCKEGEYDVDNIDQQQDAPQENRLATLDIFAGCGGLSDGLQKSGASFTKWAIEYEQPAGEAFQLNHPEARVFIDNCNVILRAIMEKCGDADDCISTSEADELVALLGEEKINNLPSPGEVDFINGGPPCQGFSGMNRFNQSTWSKVQCEMILAFLSFADYFRPRFFLLENVRNFVSFNKGQTFRLSLASLLEMGYQVRFGVLEAGAFGVSQSRKRAFIWAASPEEKLPEWPEPMHVFSGPELKITLPGDVQYAAVRSTAGGAPLRSITVKDTIGDLPPVGNGASKMEMNYGNDPMSWFQKQIRGSTVVLSDHISKEMNELNLIRCQRIPKRPGADWHDLPDEKVKLFTGQMVDLIPWCLPNTAQRHNQWKGLFGRLDWEGNFPTSITDPQPMGKVGMCFHPDQDRILTVRECARSQGFLDSYKFAGNIQSKHRQIGNAVPPPLAFALGKKLKEVLDARHST